MKNQTKLVVHSGPEQKKKRLKRVFSNHSQVIHLWANQSQSDARCKNVFFSGKSVWSYGHHYELGRLVEFKGVTVALINDTGYSVTTSKHIGSAWHAVAHMPRIKTHDFNIKAGLLKTQGELVDQLMGIFSQRSFWRANQFESDSYLVESIEEFNKTATLLGFENLVIDLTEDFKALAEAHAGAAIAKSAERDALAKDPEVIKQKQELALRRAAKQVEAWRAGGQSTNAVSNLYPQILRIVGEDVQTSRGATVPLSHALRLLRMIDKGSAKRGESVGSFKLDSVQGETIKIGCHTINLSEARAVLAARTLKVVA